MSLTIGNLTSIINTNEELLTVKELLNKLNYNYNELYVDKFWDNIENDKWVYIDSEMLKYIGYSENIIKAKQNYLNIISSNFEENIEYKSIFSKELQEDSKYLMKYIENTEINTHNKTKHLMVSSDCFKQSLMLLRTEKAKEIRKYYTELEKIFKFYLQYQTKYQELKNTETNNELQEERKKNTNLTNNAIDYNQLQKKEYLYIATNSRYASQNNFKIGKTNDLKQRLSQYNTSHNKHEKYYYVFVSEPTYYAKSIEYIIKHILTKFKNSDTNEIYVIHYEFLEKIVKNICTNYNASIDYYNECIKEEMNNMNKEPIIPKDIFNINNDVTEEVEEILFNDQKVVIEYYDNNKEFEFIRFKNKDKKMNYKCNRCNYIFNRTDHLQEHFKRKTKCYDNSKNERLNNIKKNNNNPVMIYYRDNSEYSYYEKYLETEDCINYYCNRCDYNTVTLNSLKKHFDRKEKCYEEKVYSNDNIVIEILNNNENHKYYVTLEENIKTYNCNHCKYKTTVMGNLNRHYKGKKKCWEK
jgi:hypothetical protein